MPPSWPHPLTSSPSPWCEHASRFLVIGEGDRGFACGRCSIRSGTPTTSAMTCASSRTVHETSAPMLNTSPYARSTSGAIAMTGATSSTLRKRAALQPGSEDRHRFTGHRLVHEDADDVAITVGAVLPLAVHIVRPEYDEWQTEHSARRHQVELDCVLGDAIRILG